MNGRNGGRKVRIRSSLALVIPTVFVLVSSAVAQKEHGDREGLRSESAETRAAAAAALAKARDWDGVRAALEDPDKSVRIAALRFGIGLGQYRFDPEAMQVCYEALRDKDEGVRAGSVGNLRDYVQTMASLGYELDPEFCDAVRPLLSDPSRRVRLDAFGLAQNCHGENVEGEFLRVASDKNEPPDARARALRSLAGSKTKDVDLAVMPLLGENDPLVQAGALMALGGLKSDRAVKSIAPFLRNESPGLRHESTEALNQIGGPGAARALAAALVDDKGKVDPGILRALCKASSPEVLPALLAARERLSDRYAKQTYASALAATKSDDAVPPLLVLANEEDKGLRQAAARALQEFDSPMSLRKIIEAAASHLENEDLRRVASQAQRTLDDPENARRERQRREEDLAFRAEESEIWKVEGNASRLVELGKYDRAVPMLIESAAKAEDLFSRYPGHFTVGNPLFRARGALIHFYRWKAKDPRKSIEEYGKLASAQSKFWPSDGRVRGPKMPGTTGVFIGEIYEKDLLDYPKAIQSYQAVIDAFPTPTHIKEKQEMLMFSWYVDWLRFLVERINVRNLKTHEGFSKRTIQYPSLEFRSFNEMGIMMMVVPLGGDLMATPFTSNLEERSPRDAFEELCTSQPGTFQVLFAGMSLFHGLLREQKIDDAGRVLATLERFYPDDPGTIMLELELADFYETRELSEKSREVLARARTRAQSINAEIVFAPAPVGNPQSWPE